MVDHHESPDLLKLFYVGPPPLTTSKEYDINSDDDDERYAKVQNMINNIADKLRRANPISSNQPKWWNENNSLFITAFTIGIIDSIQLIRTNEIMSHITYKSFKNDYQNIDMFLSSFSNKNNNVKKIRVNMKLERVVPGSIFYEGPRLGGKKCYTLNKNCKKIKYRKQTSTRYRKRVKKRT